MTPSPAACEAMQALWKRAANGQRRGVAKIGEDPKAKPRDGKGEVDDARARTGSGRETT